MARAAYGKDVPLLPQYGKELPQLPLQMGNERPLGHGKGGYCQFVVEIKDPLSLMIRID